MSETESKQQLVDCVLMLERAGIIDYNGHCSVRVGDNRILVNIGSSPRSQLTPDDICAIDIEGQLIEGKGNPPLECHLHCGIYRARSDVKAVVHGHTKWTTFLTMVGTEHLPDDFAADIARYRFRGSSGKVNLALDALPDFRAMPGAGPHLRGAISISPSVDYMERAYDDAKYGRYSRRPYIDMVIPSLTDPSVAPPGKHVMSCFVQYAPYHLEAGTTWDREREAFGNTVIDTIAEYAPNIRNIILHRQVLTPLDIERDFGLSEGNIFQGELTLEQLFFLRPAPGWAQYRTPIGNLYMCGSSTHPGGGIMGASGRNAAGRILKETGAGA